MADGSTFPIETSDDNVIQILGERTGTLDIRGKRNWLRIGAAARFAGALAVEGDDNAVEIEPTLNPFKPGLGHHTGALTIKGHRNRVFIGEGARFDGQIEIVGNDSVVEIGPWGAINATYLGIQASASRIQIGHGSSLIHSAVHVYEPGSITIGRNTAISANCWLSNTDMHPMYDAETGERINPAADVVVGDRAWIGLRSIVLKGSTIEDGGIVGAGSTVCGRVAAKTVVGGNPARVLRENVEWKWDLPTPPA